MPPSTTPRMRLTRSSDVTPPPRRLLPSVLVVLGALVVAGVWCVVPQSAFAMVLYEGTGYGAALLIVVGVQRRRPALRWPWLLLAAAVALNATGDLLFDFTEVVGKMPGYTSAIRRSPRHRRGRRGGRGRRRDLTVLIDGAIVALAAWLVIWVVAVQPQIDTSHIGFADWMPTLVYPPLDLLVAVAIWRVGRGDLRRCGSWMLLAAWSSVMVLADILYAVLAMPTDGVWNRLLSVGYLLAYAAAGAAALHPDMVHIVADPEPVFRPMLQRTRIAGVALALAVPGVLLLAWANNVAANPDVVAIVSLALLAGGVARVLIGVGRQREAEVALAWYATHDPLTGLPNRIALVERIDAALRRGRRQGRSCSVLFLDLDEFKVINDSLGHTVGDELLVAVAARLQSAVRSGDSVARLGGDEFVVLCEDLADGADANIAARRVLTALHEPFRVAGAELHINASVGMVMDAQDALNDPEILLRDADVAMYHAKAEGRGRVEVFAASMHQRISDRLETETALRRALTAGELRLAFQPIVGLEEGSIDAWEALIRWDRPGVGMVLPDAFISVAEGSGLIVDIGAWVLRSAARWIATLRARNASIRMAVNVSARELHHAEMASSAIEILATERVDPAALLLEITESALLEPTQTVAANLALLHDAGFHFAIDDFGTGYSSLSSLKKLDVDTLKIDKTFTDGLDNDADDVKMVATIIEMAHSLGIEVTAEGVERPEQLEILRSLGCDSAQGYLFGRATFEPLPELLRETIHSHQLHSRQR